MSYATDMLKSVGNGAKNIASSISEGVGKGVDYTRAAGRTVQNEMSNAGSNKRYNAEALRYALAGVSTGIGAAAMLNLIREFRQLTTDRKKSKEEQRTGKGTIVLTLPSRSKVAEIVSDKPVVTKKDTPASKTICGLSRKAIQPRRMNGTLADKVAGIMYTRDPWHRITLKWLLAVAGTGAGVAAVNNIVEGNRERQLRQQLENSQQEYMDKLVALESSKTAEYFDLTKSAGVISPILAAVAFTALLGTGGVGYITKRILDERDESSKNVGMDAPKLNKIVIRSAPLKEETVDEKFASKDEVDSVICALALTMDSMRDSNRIIDHPAVKMAMSVDGVTADELLKLAQDDGSIPKTIQFFMTRPQLCSLIKTKFASIKEATFTNTVLGGTALANVLSSDNQLSEEDIQKIVEAVNTKKERRKPVKATGITMQAEDEAARAYLAQNRDKIVAALQAMAASGKI